MNTFGRILRLTTAGESHGPALCAILDGLPAGIKIDTDRVDLDMSLRRPGQPLGTTRNETDHVTFLSGMLDGVSLGTPIAFTIANSDARSGDYDHMRTTFRPSHADYTYQAKYGIRDHRGGGRASARETALRVAAGAIAMQVLESHGISICAYTRAIGLVDSHAPFREYDFDEIYGNPSRCPLPAEAAKMEEALAAARREGSSLGGVISCVATGVPVGIGEPLYDKLSARLAFAMMSIPAAHGFEYGLGFDGATIPGHEAIDPFAVDGQGRITTVTNNSGGIQGGISNGAPITFNVAFKPIATLMRNVESVGPDGRPVVITPRGRHDVCAVPRGVPVVRAMAALTILDAMLMARTNSL